MEDQYLIQLKETLHLSERDAAEAILAIFAQYRDITVIDRYENLGSLLVHMPTEVYKTLMSDQGKPIPGSGLESLIKNVSKMPSSEPELIQPESKRKAVLEKSKK